MTGGAADLVERDVELARVDDLLVAAAGGAGRVLVFGAEAGIGKTALLEAAAHRAAGRGFAVLRGRGGELERPFAHGVMRQLFEPLVARAEPQERAALLAGAAAAAGGAIGLGARARGGSARDMGAAFEIQHGIYWLTANLAERAPLLIVVDDIHWADSASVHCLVYLARRLDDLPVSVLIAVRSGDPGAGDDAVLALLAEPAVEVLEVPVLSVDGTARLVREALGADAAPAFCLACHETSAGNPFLLGAMLDELARARVAPTSDAVAQVVRLGPPVVARNVLLRLARMGPDAVAFAEAAAVLDPDCDVSRIAALAGLEPARARSAADALVAAHILEAGTMRFRHPILRTVVYEDTGQVRRGATHRQAAKLLITAGYGERAAVHLLATEAGGEPWALDCLHTAAEGALERGEPEVALELLRRALDETEEPELRGEVLGNLGRVELTLGRPEGDAHLAEALALVRDPSTRAELARARLWALSTAGQISEARAIGARLLEELPAGDDASRLEMELATVAIAQYDLGASMELTERLEALVDRVDPDTTAGRRVLGALAFHRLLWGRTTGQQVADLAERALAQGRLIEEVPPGDPFVVMVLSVLQLCERDQLIELYGDAAHAAAAARGSVLGLAATDMIRGRLALYRGDLGAAEGHTREAARLADLIAAGEVNPFATATLLSVLIQRGELEGAERLLGERELVQAATARNLTMWTLLQERSVLRRAQGRFDEALVDAQAARELRESRLGCALLGRSAAALATHALGDQTRARELAAADLEAAEAWGIPSTTGMALRVAGLVHDGAEGVGFLQASVEQLESSPRRLEHARALVDLGAALRRSKQRTEAREPLERGMDIAARCGAVAVAERARAELVACGARPRRLVRWGIEALTASERRVADLAASGLTNREIAQALFVTRKTVESHLAAIYRKVDVNSREALAVLLAKDQGPPPDAGSKTVAETASHE